jgi:hypothetical protein
MFISVSSLLCLDIDYSTDANEIKIMIPEEVIKKNRELKSVPGQELLR